MGQLLPLLNTLLDPMRTSLADMNSKIDRMVSLGEKVATAEAADARHDARLSDIEQIQAKHAEELAEVRGRNKVIVWMLAALVAPVVVTLVTIGLTTLLKLKTGG